MTSTYDASSIQVLDPTEAVRRRPGMYLGDVGPRGLEQMVTCMLSHALSGFEAGLVTLVEVRVTPEYIEVRDDGSRIPFDRTHRGRNVGTHLCHGLNYTAYEVAVATALSSRFTATSWLRDGLWSQTFRVGLPSDVPVRVRAGQGAGSVLRAAPDRTIFEDAEIDRASLRARLFLAAHDNPGLIIAFGEERFHAPNGHDDLRWIGEGYMTRWVDARLERPDWRR